MKKDVPKEFLEGYKARSNEFQDALKRITSVLQFKLSQLNASIGMRGRITKKRVKRPGKIWENATKARLTIAEAFTKVEDLLGIRIVCNNLSDIKPIIEMIQTECSILDVLDIKDKVSSPSDVGYRATHVIAEFPEMFSPVETAIPCEIQIRTLAQDTWARLSRADLYGKDVPHSIQKLAQALSSQLSTIDAFAQLIRNELNQCPTVAEEIRDTDNITPQRLALLYKDKFGEEIHEWSMVDWVKHLEEAEAKTIGDVCRLLDDTKIRDYLNKLSQQISKVPLENSEWAIYSALVASEPSKNLGVKAVKKIMQDEWDEIVAFARREALSEMPETFEEFVEMLKAGCLPVDALEELGGIQRCLRCGTDIIRPEYVAEGVLDYYGNPDTEVDLKSFFWEHPDEESVDYSGYCQWCGHQMSKDD